ncbi:hypothetical protein ACHAXA_007755 [Cyclostephanos tholiformis]|uniref:Uncharacterized protein n=1 Tax=Cyclostephanos tholiformis TaxID=382380 RepID=A0ABD3RAE2_9STRA
MAHSRLAVHVPGASTRRWRISLSGRLNAATRLRDAAQLVLPPRIRCAHYSRFNTSCESADVQRCGKS